MHYELQATSIKQFRKKKVYKLEIIPMMLEKQVPQELYHVIHTELFIKSCI